MARIVPTGAWLAGYHSKLTGIVPAAGSARSNGTRSFPHQAPSRSGHGSSRSRPTASWSSDSWAAAIGARPTAVTAASSRAGTNRDRRWRIRDHGQKLNDRSILRSAESGSAAGGSAEGGGDAGGPGPGPAQLVTLARLELQLDLEGVGVAAQVEPGAGGHGRLRPVDAVRRRPAGPGQPRPVKGHPHRALVAPDQPRPAGQLGPAAVVDLGLGPVAEDVAQHPTHDRRVVVARVFGRRGPGRGERRGRARAGAVED